jgi:hypothetical protein
MSPLLLPLLQLLPGLVGHGDVSGYLRRHQATTSSVRSLISILEPVLESHLVQRRFCGRPRCSAPPDRRPRARLISPTPGGKGLLCQRPCLWRPGGSGGAESGGGVVAVPRSRHRPRHHRRHRPDRRHPPARPGTGTIPGTAVAVLVLVVASAVGLVRSRAGGRRGRGRRGKPHDLFERPSRFGSYPVPDGAPRFATN